jgi:protein-tyrosine phosphatase
LYAGRRVLASELPPGVALVIDLTAEFPEPRGVRTGRAYRSLPVLDAGLPDEAAFREAVKAAAACPGAVYVHCAQGRGRTGLFVAAVLLARGLATTSAEAVARVRACRPGVRLKPAQRRTLDRFAAANPAYGTAPPAVLP